MNVMVVGGAGFIGSHLVDRLWKDGYAVTVVDDLSTGSSKNLNPSVRLYNFKAESEEMLKVLEFEKPETLFFLAANSNVPLSVRDPLFDFKSLTSALNVMEGCRKFGVKRFVFTSSGFIYGNTSRRPIGEDEPFQPISPYAISKQAIEHYLAFYRNVYGLSYVVLRLATVYGPRQVTGALSDYVTRLSRGEQAEFFGDGSKTRDYVYVDDVIAALMKCMTLNVPANPVFNIGSGQEITLLDVYKEIAKLLNTEVKPIIRPDRPGELYGYSLSNTKADMILGWKPTTGFSEGLQKILAYRNLLNKRNV
jgi:UDP-glucose 4-epimerase